MADVATMTAPQTVEEAPDAHVTNRTWATEIEVLAAAQLDAEERGVRFRRDRAEWVVHTYNALRKRQAIGGDGTVSKHQLVRDLYPDVEADYKRCRSLGVSVSRWLDVLVRQGLITRAELRSEHGGGKCLGLRVQLSPVPERVAMLARSRGCSSVG